MRQLPDTLRNTSYLVGFLTPPITKPSEEFGRSLKPSAFNFSLKDGSGVCVLLFVGSVLSFGADELAFFNAGLGV